MLKYLSKAPFYVFMFIFNIQTDYYSQQCFSNQVTVYVEACVRLLGN